MSLWKIAWRSIQQRGLSSWLTGLSMALGVALVSLVLVIHSVIERSFSEAAQGYNLIVGKQSGSPLDLVLNVIFHLGRQKNFPISWADYNEFLIRPSGPDGKKVIGKYANGVDVAVPVCLGDTYSGFRVVATSPEYFEKISYGSDSQGNPKNYRCAQGRFFHQNEFLGAVFGSIAAYKTGVKLDQQFSITHGVPTDPAHPDIHTEVRFKVMGILAPTGTPNDRAVFINIEGFYKIPEHQLPVDKEGKVLPEVEEDNAGPEDPNEHNVKIDFTLPVPENQRQLTAVLVRTNNDINARVLYDELNKKGTTLQAVYPVQEVTTLMQGTVGMVRWIMLVLAILVIVVAGIGVMVSIYNSMSDRSREIAIMRSLGASRATVMAVVLLESILLSLLGGLAGVIIAHGTIGALNPVIVDQTGFSIGVFQFEPLELILLPALVLLASIVGYLPALAAYRTDVAKALSSAP